MDTRPNRECCEGHATVNSFLGKLPHGGSVRALAAKYGLCGLLAGFPLALHMHPPAAVGQVIAIEQDEQPSDAFSDVELDIQWQPLNDSIDLARIVLRQPRPLKIALARIRLGAHIDVTVTPSNGERDKETDSLRTSSFLEKHECDLAINAAPFAPVVLFENSTLDVVGWQVADGDEVSPADIRRPVLAFLDDGTARIFAAPPEDRQTRESIVHAVTGFHLVLDDGTVRGQASPLHPRTAAGITADGKTLLLMVADGRQTGTSEGLSTVEIGQFLSKLGMDRGINLDGGGTSTMVARLPANWRWAGLDPDQQAANTTDAEQREDVDDRSELSQKPATAPTVINTPIHAGIAGLERPAGSHLGLRVLRKEK